jgi:hypothetical protein
MSNAMQNMIRPTGMNVAGGKTPATAAASVPVDSGLFAELLRELLYPGHDARSASLDATGSGIPGQLLHICTPPPIVEGMVADVKAVQLPADADATPEGRAGEGVEGNAHRIGAGCQTVTGTPLVIPALDTAADVLRVHTGATGVPECTEEKSPTTGSATTAGSTLLYAIEMQGTHIPYVKHCAGGWALPSTQSDEPGDIASDAHIPVGKGTRTPRWGAPPNAEAQDMIRASQDAVSLSERADRDGDVVPGALHLAHQLNDARQDVMVQAAAANGQKAAPHSSHVPSAPTPSPLNHHPGAGNSVDINDLSLHEEQSDALLQRAESAHGVVRETGRDAGSYFIGAYRSAPIHDPQGAARPADAAVPIEYISVVEQVSRPFLGGLQVGAREVVIRLEPEHLGMVRVRLSVENGMVSARIAVESRQVKEMLEAGMPMLHDTLRAHGLTCERMDVRVDQPMVQHDQGRSPAEHGQGDPRGFEARPDIPETGRHRMHVLSGYETRIPVIPGTVASLGVNVLV